MGPLGRRPRVFKQSARRALRGFKTAHGSGDVLQVWGGCAVASVGLVLQPQQGYLDGGGGGCAIPRKLGCDCYVVAL